MVDKPNCIIPYMTKHKMQQMVYNQSNIRIQLILTRSRNSMPSSLLIKHSFYLCSCPYTQMLFTCLVLIYILKATNLSLPPMHFRFVFETFSMAPLSYQERKVLKHQSSIQFFTVHLARYVGHLQKNCSNSLSIKLILPKTQDFCRNLIFQQVPFLIKHTYFNVSS